MTETPAIRIRKITALLRTLDDPLPSAKGLRLASQPGPAPDGRVRCSCARILQTHPAPTLVGDPDCYFCHGAGLRPRIHGLDGNEDYERGKDGVRRLYDLYTYAADVKGVVPSPPPERRSLADPRPRDFGFIEARKAQERSGSYRELRLGLEVLLQRDYPAYVVIQRADVEGRYGFEDDALWSEPRLSFGAGFTRFGGLTFLERRMPMPVRVPGWIGELLEAALRAEQMQRMAGHSERAIARALGVSRRTVRKRVRAA